MLAPWGLFVAQRDYGALADAVTRSMKRPDHAADGCDSAQQGGGGALALPAYSENY